MYLSFYGLKEEPFHVTPDPNYFFASTTHREALASIVYGVNKRKGFISLIGEVGTGKTTIIRAFLQSIENAKIKSVLISNPVD
jgi:general secretion pathway protein A